MNYSIAVDGPAGAGKSTIAKRIAKETAFIYVDTGAMYRAMAVYFLDNGIDAADESAVNAACGKVSVVIGYDNGVQQVFLNGENVTARLRSEEVGTMASKISVYPKVRKKLVELQRELAEKSSVIMDGRDIGTCVLPDANLKIFLTASVEARAKRRFEELREKGETPDYGEIAADIKERDNRDMNREVSPLRPAEDAVLVDSSYMGIEDVVKTVLDLFDKKCKQMG